MAIATEGQSATNDQNGIYIHYPVTQLLKGTRVSPRYDWMTGSCMSSTCYVRGA